MKHLISKIRFSLLTLLSILISLSVISISYGDTLRWDPNSEEDLVKGYKLWFGLSSEEYVWSINVGNVTEYPIPPSWPKNVTYYVAMKAYNTSGYSEFSHELPFVINPSEEDADSDGIPDDGDNCPETPNGSFGTCKSGYFIGNVCLLDDGCGLGGFCSLSQEDTDDDGLGDVCDPDADDDGISNDQDDCPFDPDNDIDNDDVCGDVDNCPDHYNPYQEDNYPPGGNGCGDACECEGDFDNDGDVDGSDTIKFLEDIGRSQYKDPCTNGNPCNGDFDCDGDVDGSDAFMFKQDFGRMDCPICPFSCY